MIGTKRRCYFRWLISILSFWIINWAQGQTVPLTRIPFLQVTGGVIIIQAQLTPHEDTLQFIFDTGSSGISLDSATAQHLGCKPTYDGLLIRGIAGVREVPQLRQQTLTIGGLRTDSLDFYINDYSVLTSIYGVRIDGVIGYAMLSRYIVSIDYEKQCMEWFAPGTFNYPRKGWLLQPQINRLPAYPFTIQELQTKSYPLLIDIGAGAGRTNQGLAAISIGYVSGDGAQGSNAIAIGGNSAQSNQATQAVAIGYAAGQYNQGSNAVAIGSFAGNNGQVNNSIAINATGSALSPTNQGLYINPIREANSTNLYLNYNSSSKEVTYSTGQALSPTYYGIYTPLTSSINGAIIYTEHGGHPVFPDNLPDGFKCTIIMHSNHPWTSNTLNTARFFSRLSGWSSGSAGRTTFSMPSGGVVEVRVVTINNQKCYFLSGDIQ